MRNEGTMMSTYRTLLLLIILLTIVSFASAQTYRGSIRGTLTDSNGAVIWEVRVSATNLATGEVRTAVSNEDGEYALSSLVPGRYRLQFEKANFLSP
jgi:hypothetical protein